MAGQLGVPDLVAPGAEIAGLFDSAEEVGESESWSVEQDSLVDDIHTGLHRLQRVIPSLGEAFPAGKVMVEVQLHCP